MAAPEQLRTDSAAFRDSYAELIGFVPPRVAARFEITASPTPHERGLA